MDRLIVRLLRRVTGTVGFRWIYYQPVARISRDPQLTWAD